MPGILSIGKYEKNKIAGKLIEQIQNYIFTISQIKVGIFTAI